jgi:Flp pilus assembly protein TadD
MRSATVRNLAILGLVGSIAALYGCSELASGDGGSVAPTLTAAVPPVVAADLPASTPVPVDPALVKASWKDGVALFERGDYAAAAGTLRLAILDRPDAAYRHYLLGLALWKSGDPESAEASLVRSTSLDPTQVKSWINLARVRHDLRDRTGALDAADEAVRLDPTSADAMHQRGRALMELGRGEQALDALTTAHDLDRDNGYIANTLGLLLIQTGKAADAIEPLEVAKVALPHVAYVRNNLGVAYERAGRLEEAKLEYLAAVEAGDAGGKGMRSLVRLGATDSTVPSAEAVTTASIEKP